VHLRRLIALGLLQRVNGFLETFGCVFIGGGHARQLHGVLGFIQLEGILLADQNRDEAAGASIVRIHTAREQFIAGRDHFDHAAGIGTDHVF
jgi:hypothetical protein